ncbi:MAG: bifunctional [glutamine synthetase] adenylyltransferase/[glutamine synthetase]-adenylyl-L-tyrosine phosphorylase [Xanthobacteraceae bacterium]
MNSASNLAAGSLAQRLATAPRLRAADDGQARLDDWLAEIAGTPAGKVLKRLLAAHPLLGALMMGLAEFSPYLWELAHAEPERLVALLESEPERRFEDILAGAATTIAATHDQVEVMRLLRRMKAEAALLIAFADIGNVWPLTRVIELQTRLADAAVSAAVDHLLADAQRRGRLDVASRHPAQGSGYIVLAMGKMGAGELNYSSDIDLIVFYDGAALAPGLEPAPFYVRLTRALVKLLQERTSDGYVFRTDLRLRPDPASTQIAISTAAALDYYESRGQNWERAALIKARPCAGDVAAGEALLAGLAPFIWRKYLDFAAVADIHAMKRQIHVYRGHDEIAVEGHNIKLGRGGIREIEFFVQTQQLIAGGRHPRLRVRETLRTLDMLAEGGWIGEPVRDDLGAAYRFLRTVENRLQMVADEQTHNLPADRDGLERFSSFAGFGGRDAFADALLVHLRNVQRHYATLFENAPALEAGRRALRFPPAADDRETLDRLSEMGFRQPLEISALVRRWGTPAHDSLRSEFARNQLAEIVPVLLNHFARSANPDAAVIAFDRFLGGLHGGGRLFSLLRQNPDLIALIALVLGTAPRLAESLAQFPEVMDAVIDPSFFGALPEESELAAGLERSLRQAGPYEDFLDRVRIFAQEQMFLVGTRILSGTVSAEQAGEAFARVADVLIRSLHRAVEDNFARLHGRVAGQETAILALGKLGGREMTATSDLDLIVVYDFDPERPESGGPRALYGAQYFSRLTQRLISALTAQTNHGLLYRVDMRLRPSGRAGPLATQIDGFASYQETEAWTWEHLALTRARVVSASPPFAVRIEAVIREVLRRPRDPETLAGDVVEMRKAIATERGDDDRWDLKYVAGGLIDIEFIAQYLQLVHAAATPEILDTSTVRVLDKAWRLGLIAAEEAEVLRPAARLYHDLTQILRLCLPGRFDPQAAAPGLLALLARAADVPDFARLDADMGETQAKVRASFDRILGSRP